MNISNTKRGTKLLALATVFVLFAFTSSAQNLINNATGKVNNQGTIRFMENNADFKNDAAITNITNTSLTGGFQFFGTDQAFTGTNPLTSTSTLRIPGFVSYRATSGNQNVHPGYYTHLDVRDASTKTFASSQNFFIGGNYTTAGGNRTYTGSLVTYDGTAPTPTQNIAAENSTNGGGYNNLAFENTALKTLSTGTALVTGTTNIAANTATGGVVIDGTSGGAIEATGNFTQAAGAGDFTLNAGGLATLNGAANTIDANTVVNNGTLTLGANSVTTVTGAVNLTDAAGNSDFALGNTATFNVNGAFTNTDQARTNMTFDATSTVDYQTGASNIITTATTNPYGNFIVSKSDAAISPTNSGGTEDNINIATSFALNGGQDLDMNGTTGGAVNMLTNATGVVTYAGQEEVIGNFRRTATGMGAGPYTFNNASTTIAFPTQPAGGNYFEVHSLPGTSNFNYDATRDVHRQIHLNYDYTGWVATVQIGYDQSEATGWTAGYTESQIRYLEGDPAAASTERVATGNAYTRANSTPTTFGTVSLPGFEPTATAIDGTADAGFLTANELILRAGPGVVASVQPGRWSNPATWDTGEEPLAFDSVLVRHNVWAGYVNNKDGFTDDETHPTELAAAINIITPTATYPTPTLLIGSSDIVGPFKTSVPGANGTGSVYVGGLGGATPKIPALADEIPATDVAADYIAGLVVFGQTLGTDVPEFIVEGNVVIDGAINIGGILTLGQ